MKIKLTILLLISLVNNSSSSVKFELVDNPNIAGYKKSTLFLEEIIPKIIPKIILEDSENLTSFLEENLSKITPDHEIIYQDIYTTATPWFLDDKLKDCFIIAKEDIKVSPKIGDNRIIGGKKQKTWFICPKK